MSRSVLALLVWSASMASIGCSTNVSSDDPGSGGFDISSLIDLMNTMTSVLALESSITPSSSLNLSTVPLSSRFSPSPSLSLEIVTTSPVLASSFFSSRPSFTSVFSSPSLVSSFVSTPLVTSTFITSLISSSPVTISPSSSSMAISTPASSSSSESRTTSTQSSSSSSLSSRTRMITSSSSLTTSTTGSAVATTVSQNNPVGAVVGGVFAAVSIVALLIIIALLILFIRKRSRNKKYVLPSLALENSESVILLRDMSNSMHGQDKKLSAIFAHIPSTPAIQLSSLEEYVAHLHEGEEDDNALEEFHFVRSNLREGSCAASQMKVNSTKNRYIDILPFDDTRVLLSSKMDYINANYLAGYSNPKEYIAAQGPLSNTIDDFWQMVWETGCDTIVMLTNPVEAGYQKCEVYWPEEGRASQFSTVSVSHTKELVQPSCTTRHFVLSAVQEKKARSSVRLSSRECKQFHFTSWPDMGVPMDIVTMIRFIKRVRSSVMSTENPIVVHCSAGVGRTGTFIAIDVQMQRMENTKSINVKEMVMRMRAQRPNMVQTVAQYIFIYDCLLHEYLYGETEVTKESIKSHFDKLLDMFPNTEDTHLEKEYEGANMIVHPDESLLEVATSPKNVRKNRNGAGLPLDLNRVHLNDPFSSGNDYINATYLGVFGRKAEFIITQHPLPNTQEDFWRMLLERTFGTVVILGPVKEEDAYWSAEKPVEYEEIVVRLLECDESDYVKVIVLEVECEEMDECLTVKVFQLHWPVDDVPSSTKGILELSDLLREHSKGLVVVHTSASVSDQCSGVFCMIHSLGTKLADGHTVDIMGSCKRVLQQRQGCITSKEQYQFIYEALIDKI